MSDEARQRDHNSAIRALIEIVDELDLADGCLEDADIVAGVRQLRAERDRLRAIVETLRRWQAARDRLRIADSVDDEDRATDALDVIGRELLAQLAALDRSEEGT